MIMRKCQHILLALSSLLSVASSGQAASFSTYDGITPGSGSQPVSYNFSMFIDPITFIPIMSFSGQKEAVSFTTDANTYQLESATINLSGNGGILNLHLYSDNSGIPNISLETLTAPATLGSQNNYTFTSSGYELEANTTYWIVAEPSMGFSGNWYNGTTGSGYALSSMNSVGGMWNPWTFQSGTPMSLQVNLSAVPEPSAYALAMGVGLVAWAGAKRFRRL